MRKVFDIILGCLFGVVITIAFMPKELVLNYESWLGVSIGLGFAYCSSKWNKDKINELEEEIKKLKENNGNR